MASNREIRDKLACRFNEHFRAEVDLTSLDFGGIWRALRSKLVHDICDELEIKINQEVINETVQQN